MSDIIKKTMIENYNLQFGHGDYAKINLECWNGGGAFNAMTSYGNYNYIWNAIGDQHFKEFLCGLNYDYAMGKLTSDCGNMFQIDYKRTQKAIRNDILQKRKNGEIEAPDARQYWNETDGILGISNPAELSHYFSHCQFTNLYENYLGEFIFEMPTPQVENFWREVWNRMIPVWKEEIAVMKKETVDA